MSKTFKIILSIASVIAFLLLFVCLEAEWGEKGTYVGIPVILFAAVGALRIIWKKDKGTQQ